MKQVIVSTLICTYNAENFITTTLDSVVRQTLKSQEILILDNDSKDDTLQVLKEYAKKDDRIKVFSEWKNLGPYNGLNYLMERSKWKYIAIQDHDDIWHSKKLEIQIDFLEKNPRYVGSGTGSLMYYGKQRLGFVYDDKNYDTTKVIHTSLVFRNDGYRYDYSKDFLCDGYFMQKILTKDKNLLKVIPEVLTLHYYKGTWSNYSEQWFKVNIKNIQRYFEVYWYGLYHVFLFCYLLFCKILPRNFKNQLDFALLSWLKGAQSKEVLEKRVFLDELLSSYD